jgi:hypothetical protein
VKYEVVNSAASLSNDSKTPLCIFSNRQQSRLLQTFSISLPKYRPSYPEGGCVGTHRPDSNSHLTNRPVGIFLQCPTRPSDGGVQSAYVLVATTLLRYGRTPRFEILAQKAKTMTRAQNGPTPVPLCHWQCPQYHLTERLFVSPADTPLCHGFLATTRQKA